MRNKLHLEAPLEIGRGEPFVLSHVGRDDPGNLTVLEQKAEAFSIHSHIVRDNREVAYSGVPHRLDEERRNSAQSEAPNCQGHAVTEHAVKDFMGACPHFGHRNSFRSDEGEPNSVDKQNQ